MRHSLKAPTPLGAASRSLALLLMILPVVGCGTPGLGDGPDYAPGPGQGPWQPSAGTPLPGRALEPGHIVSLAPVVIVAEGAGPGPAQLHRDATTLETLLGSALIQSHRLDVAVAGNAPDDCDRILCVFDLAAGTATATLEANQGAPTAIAAMPLRPDPTRTVDGLAAWIRIHLGEELAAAPVPVALAATGDGTALRLLARADDHFEAGRIGSALGDLRRARRLDGGSPTILAQLARALRARGEFVEAARVAQEALGYTRRLTWPVQHSLVRTMLLSRAAAEPALGQRHDEELLTYAQAAATERPFDQQWRISMAYAQNQLGDFGASLPLLRGLHQRLPMANGIAWHLTFAEHQAGDPERALDAIESVRRRMPPAATLVPHALALLQNGLHQELDDLLRRAERREAARGASTQGDILQMQACHAMLTDRPDTAADLLLTWMEWLRQAPSRIVGRTSSLVASGRVLLALGRLSELERGITAMAATPALPPATKDACAFLAALCHVHRNLTRDTDVERMFLQGGSQREVWANILKATAHRLRGELAEEVSALARAAQFAPGDVMTKWRLAIGMARMGQTTEASQLQRALLQEIPTIDLRMLPVRRSHPLLAPASSWIVAQVRSGG